MQRLVVSTNDVPESDRFTYWRESVKEGLFGVSAERNKDQETPFHARVEASIGESVARIRTRCDRYPVFRRSRDIARIGWDGFFFLHRENSQGNWFRHSGREFVTKAGDLVVGDLTVPFATEALDSYDHELWFFPSKLLDPHLPASLHPRSLVLNRAGGVAGMIKAYLEAFAAQMGSLDDREVAAVAENFCRLLSVACGAAAGEHKESIRLARLEEAKRYIGWHLADPGLTPEKAAAALKMSMRQLHLLFEPTGTSFAQYVLQRRLEECRAALLSPVGARSITDIALGFGFNSLWTFNRTFRRTFGVTPSEVRGRAAGPR